MGSAFRTSKLRLGLVDKNSERNFSLVCLTILSSFVVRGCRQGASERRVIDVIRDPGYLDTPKTA